MTLASGFINETGTLGVIFQAVTLNITGNEFLTLLGLLLLILLFFMLFRIPIEASAILILPLLIILMASTGEFFAIGGVMLIYLALLFAKNWLF